MSRIPKRYCRECGGKRLYVNDNQARDSLGRALRESVYAQRDDDYTLNVYPCPHHKGFHIGHNPATKRIIEQAAKDRRISI